MKNLLLHFRFWLIFKLWPYRRGSAHFCANRQEWTFVTPSKKAEFMLRVRDLQIKDSYSREELLTMLATIRREETKQDWLVPEPDDR
jgi:hypothetical protein